MVGQRNQHLNRLQHELPNGLLVDSQWLERRGLTRQLRSHYVKQGWLESPARAVYRRPAGQVAGGTPPEARWEPVLVSLQQLLRLPVVIGGRSALSVQGYAHYLELGGPAKIHLYANAPLPGWLRRLPGGARYVGHRVGRLFNSPLPEPLNDGPALAAAGLVERPSGNGEWPLVMSSPERAMLELLDELPNRESFDNAEKMFEGLATLSPRRLEVLLNDCKSVKVKRLFFYFAARHKHAWARRLDPAAFDLGSGKRVLIPGGKLDPQFQITVPERRDGEP